VYKELALAEGFRTMFNEATKKARRARARAHTRPRGVHGPVA
jgi:hypothetical protein